MPKTIRYACPICKQHAHFFITYQAEGTMRGDIGCLDTTDSDTITIIGGIYECGDSDCCAKSTKEELIVAADLHYNNKNTQGEPYVLQVS